MSKPDASYLHIPLCSKDFTFENIFSTESISPPQFYTDRQFGIKYFFPIPGLSEANSIILFDKPPSFNLNEMSRGVLKFILAVRLDQLDVAFLEERDGGIYSYIKTIHLNIENCKFLFFSERDIIQLRLTSQTSMPTKDTEKYALNFSVIGEDSCTRFNLSNHRFHQHLPNKFIQQLMADKKFNCFKGFVYGLYAGRLRVANFKKHSFETSLQDILNCFGDFKSRLESDLGSNNKLEISLDRLKKSIRRSQSLFGIADTNEAVTEAILSEFLFSHFHGRFRSIQSAEDFLNTLIVKDAVLKTNDFETFQNFYSSIVLKDSALSYFRTLFQKIGEYSSLYKVKSSFTQKKFKEILDQEFKNAVFSLIELSQKTSFFPVAELSIPLENISVDQQTGAILFLGGFDFVNDSALQEFTQILNLIYDLGQKRNGEILKEDLLSLIEIIENSYKQNKVTGKSNLYKYLNNEIDFYSIDSVSSLVMKNFIAFIFHHSSLNNLIDFVESKKIDDPWMAYCFWCTLNGFANINGTFVQPLFLKESRGHQVLLDNYFSKIRNTFYSKDVIENYNLPVSNNNYQEASPALHEMSKELSIPIEKLVSLSKETYNAFSSILKSQYKIKTGSKKIYKRLLATVSPPLFE